jgi:hypothetical protein
MEEGVLDVLTAFPPATSGLPTRNGARAARREHVDFSIDQMSTDAINRSAAHF